jgi:hypothetical protein
MNNVSVPDQYKHGMLWRTPDDYEIVLHSLRDHVSSRVLNVKILQ